MPVRLEVKYQIDFLFERVNMKLLLGIFCVSFLSCFVIAQDPCETPSITTNSGTRATTGPICSGDLIFEDTFEEFAPNVISIQAF